MYTDHNMTAAHFSTHQTVDNTVAQLSQSSSKHMDLKLYGASSCMRLSDFPLSCFL
jgi:hypothetical protein